MTDDLRTRIAAAALNAYEGRDNAWKMSEGDVRRKDWLEIADAVIRELDSQGLLIDSEAGNRLNRLEGRR